MCLYVYLRLRAGENRSVQYCRRLPGKDSSIVLCVSPLVSLMIDQEATFHVCVIYGMYGVTLHTEQKLYVTHIFVIYDVTYCP